MFWLMVYINKCITKRPYDV